MSKLRSYGPAFGDVPTLPKVVAAWCSRPGRCYESHVGQHVEEIAFVCADQLLHIGKGFFAEVLVRQAAKQNLARARVDERQVARGRRRAKAIAPGS